MSLRAKDSRGSSGGSAALPLPTLLSMALVAFTIEFDNEFEHGTPHRTARYGGPRGAVWLGSLVLWSTCMRFLGEEGLAVGDLKKLAGKKTNLHGLERWGYIRVTAGVVRATPKGREAQEVWRPLFGIIEDRWRHRFGAAEIDCLKGALRTVIDQFSAELPDCLPILGYGMFSKGPDDSPAAAKIPKRPIGFDLPLYALLSKVLLAFAISFERRSTVSLAISANVVRVLGEEDAGSGVTVRDLPALSGIAKESIAVALAYLQKREFAAVGTDPGGSRMKLARLTDEGRAVHDKYYHLLEAIESRWKKRFGEDNIRALRESLQGLVGDATAERSPLFRGLEPYPDGWRARVPRLKTLPHYPMVTHRGGYPDGS